MSRVAITGGLSSGKSFLASELGKLGAHVVSSDKIVHHLLSHDSSVQQAVVQLLGPEVVQQEHLDRKAIANRLFHNPQLRERMERLLHPLVYQEIQRESHRYPSEKLFVAEVPLLFESGGEQFFDQVVCVDSPISDSRTWFCAAGGTPEDFDRREQSQLARSEKARRAHIVISNTGDQKALQAAALLLYRHLTQNLNEPRRDRSTG